MKRNNKVVGQSFYVKCGLLKSPPVVVICRRQMVLTLPSTLLEIDSIASLHQRFCPATTMVRGFAAEVQPWFCILLYRTLFLLERLFLCGQLKCS